MKEQFPERGRLELVGNLSPEQMNELLGALQQAVPAKAPKPKAGKYRLLPVPEELQEAVLDDVRKISAKNEHREAELRDHPLAPDAQAVAIAAAMAKLREAVADYTAVVGAIQAKVPEPAELR
ncbi:MAG: hypothetical protein ACRCZF_25485 [Gemmataceae bacterium]